MLLYFLRHGQAGHNYASDFERELTDEGKHASKNVGKFCAAMGIHFTHALVSPLVRAQQTAHAVLKKVADVPVTETKYLTPESDPRNLLELLRSYPHDSRILLVTHEPFVSTCISTLISSNEIAHVVMKTASFACIETHGTMVQGGGRLRWLLTSEMLEKLV